MVLIVMPFVSRTVMIYTLGIDYVGLGSLFSSLLGILSFAELGMGSAMVYNMYKPVADGDDDKICLLLGYYRKSYRIIGFIILFCGLMCAPFLNYLVKGNIPDGINLRMLFAIYMFNTAIGYFLFAYKGAIFLATQRVDMSTKIATFTGFVMNVLQIVAMIMFRSYYLYALLIPLFTIVQNIIIARVADKKYPQYIPKSGIAEKDVASIRRNVSGIVFQKFGGIVLTSADAVVISSFLGLNFLGIYNGYWSIITALVSLLGVLHTAIIPAIGNSLVLEDKEKNYCDFKKFNFLYAWVLIWWCACLLCMFNPFMRLWQGSENIFDESVVLLFVIFFFVHHIGDFSYLYKEACGLWWEGKLVPLISSLVNITLNVLLVQSIGIAGILLSTIISIGFINIPFGGKVLFQGYFKRKSYYLSFLFDIIKYFAICIVVSLITYALCSVYTVNSDLVMLIKNGIICLVVPNIILYFIFCRTTNYKNAKLFVKEALFQSRGIMR